MMVEKLLELFVGEIDAKLLEGVEAKNFETGDVEDADERRHRHPLRSEGGGDGTGRRGQEGMMEGCDGELCQEEEEVQRDNEQKERFMGKR